MNVFTVSPTNFYVNLIYANKCCARGLSIPHACCLREWNLHQCQCISAVVLFRDNKCDVKNDRSRKIQYHRNVIRIKKIKQKIENKQQVLIIFDTYAIVYFCARNTFPPFSHSIVTIFHSFSGLHSLDVSIRRKFEISPFRDVMVGGSSDNCYNALASTNHEPFEFQCESSLLFGLDIGALRGVRFIEQITRTREKKAPKRLLGELSASFKVHESVGEIGSMTALIRGLK